MLGLTPDQILALISSWGYVVVFPVAVIEGPIITVISGFLVSLRQFNLFLVFPLLVAADLVGDVIYYGLGRWSHGATRFFSPEKKMGAEKRSELQESFHTHLWKVLLFGKTQPIGSVILFYAGVAKVSFGRFILINLVASIPKTALFLIVGFYFGESIQRAQRYIDYVGILLFLVPLVLLGIYWYVKRYLRAEEDRLLADK